MMLLRLALAAALFPTLLLPADEVRTVTILHTNDLHARLSPLEDGRGGFAYVASVIRREREGCTGCLLLNAGDLVQGSPVSTLFRGLPVFEIANLFGFDASTLGNHDFDYGWEQARRFIDTAQYPIALANIVYDGGRLFAKQPFVVLLANGVKVAVVGAMTDTFDALTTRALRGPVREVPLLESVRRYANEAPVVISGHAHNGLAAPLAGPDHHVVARAKAYGVEVGRLRLSVNVTKKTVVSWDWQALPVFSTSTPPAPDVAAAVAKWEAEVSEIVDQPLAESAREFARKEVRRLVERAMREETGADFAFINAGGIRDNLPRGKLLLRHVWNLMPFDNRVVTGKFTGKELPHAVTRGAAVEPGRVYTLAVTDFTAENQSAPEQLGARGLKFSDTGPLLRDLLIDWIRRHKLIE